MKKYHSLAAKGEQVDVSELTKTEHTEVTAAEPVTNNQEPSPSNGVASQIIEQPQTTTGAQAAKESTVTRPPVAAAQAAPGTTSRTPAVGGTMPQALLSSGNCHCC